MLQAESESEAATLAVAGDQQVTGGFVAEMLTLMAVDRLEARLGDVKVP